MNMRIERKDNDGVRNDHGDQKADQKAHKKAEQKEEQKEMRKLEHEFERKMQEAMKNQNGDDDQQNMLNKIEDKIGQDIKSLFNFV